MDDLTKEEFEKAFAGEPEKISNDWKWGLDRLQKIVGEDNKAKGFWKERTSIDRTLILIISEIIEAHEELRAGNEINGAYYKEGKPEGFGIEIADALIRILDLAEYHNLNMAILVEEKLNYNRTRPHMHGKKF